MSRELARYRVITSTFYLEFFVMMYMIGIVTWLLVFRMTEIKECWKTHAAFATTSGSPSSLRL
ncbi:unnamed protein product [Ectocarpus sp. 6 AP-2014]